MELAKHIECNLYFLCFLAETNITFLKCACFIWSFLRFRQKYTFSPHVPTVALGWVVTALSFKYLLSSCRSCLRMFVLCNSLFLFVRVAQHRLFHRATTLPDRLTSGTSPWPDRCRKSPRNLLRMRMTIGQWGRRKNSRALVCKPVQFIFPVLPWYSDILKVQSCVRFQCSDFVDSWFFNDIESCIVHNI